MLSKPVCTKFFVSYHDLFDESNRWSKLIPEQMEKKTVYMTLKR